MEAQGAVTDLTVAGSIGLIVFTASCVILTISMLVSSPDDLPLDLALVGQNTALATACLGMAMIWTDRARSGAVAQSPYLLAMALSIVVFIQWAFQMYPMDSAMRVLLNTLPAQDSWTGRMSHMSALAIFLLSLSALLLRCQAVFPVMVSALATVIATTLALGSFAAHLAGLTLFPSVIQGNGTLSLATSFLLTLIGLGNGYQLLRSSIFIDWKSANPGQGLFVEVMILLSLLFALALGSAAEYVGQGLVIYAFGVLLCFFVVGLVVIYHPIVMLVDRSVATSNKLREREVALEQAQSQARLGSWRMLLSGDELEWSDECYRIFGMSPSTCITFDDFINAVHPDDRDHVQKSWRRALAGEQYDIEHRIVVNGIVKWVRERGHLQMDAEDRIIGGVGTVQDITQLKTREVQLRESRDQLRQLAAHKENIREDERARIARELHDEMGQQLTAIRLDAALIDKRFGHVSPRLKDMLLDMKQGIDVSINLMRNVVASLRPPALDAGLVPAVEWLLDTFQQRTDIRCSLIVDGRDAELDAERITTAFRVLQESLTNVIRHANATVLSVRITINSRELSLSIADNGVGFDPARVSACRRFGLMGIRERVLIFGGTTTIDSEPGRGTTLSVIIPVGRNAAKGENQS